MDRNENLYAIRFEILEMVFDVICFLYAIPDSGLVRDSGGERFYGGSCKPHPVFDCAHSVHSEVVSDFSSATENLEDWWTCCQNCLGRSLIQSWFLHARQPCNCSYLLHFLLSNFILKCNWK